MDSGEMNLLSGKSERHRHVICIFVSPPLMNEFLRVSSHAIGTLLLVILTPKLKLAY
jgi:hypothetical protein